MKSRIPTLVAIGLLVLVALQCVSTISMTATHNGQLKAQTEVFNAQLVAMTETHNAQLKAQTEVYNAQLVTLTDRYNAQLLAQAAEFQKK